MEVNEKKSPPSKPYDNKWPINGYSYHLDKKEADKNGIMVQYIKCIKKKCKGRGVIKNKQFRLTKNHECKQNPTLTEVHEFRKCLKQSSAVSFTTPAQIYATAAMQFPETAIEKPFSVVRRSIQRYCQDFQRERIQLFDFKSGLENFIQCLKLPENYNQFRYGIPIKYQLKIRIERLILTINKVEVPAINIYFFDESFIKDISSRIKIVMIDATYKCVPKLEQKNLQLLTLMTKVNNQINQKGAAIPFMWIIMTRKRESCYRKIFQLLKTKFPNIKLETYISDFEAAIHKSIKIVFPDIVGRHCFFHYAQAIIKKAKALHVIGANNHPATDPDIYVILKQLIALALLPVQEITPAFQLIESNCKNEFGEYFDSLLNYYKSYWMNQITPSGFSVHVKYDRTNNCIESYHRNLNNVSQKNPHPNIFLSIIKYKQIEARITWEQIKKQTYRSREETAKTINTNKEMKEFFDIYNSELKQNPNTEYENPLKLINNLKAINDLINKENKIILNQIKNIPTQLLTIQEEETMSKGQTPLCLYLPEDITEEEILELFKYIRRLHLQNNRHKILLILNEKDTSGYK